MRGSLIAASAAALLMAPVLAAQGKPVEQQQDVIPESAWPPDGMCRVWLRDVPERQQPAPTDCVTALRTRPRDATLLLGRPVENARSAQQARPATGAARDRSTLDDRALRGFGFRSVESRRVTVGMSFNATVPAAARDAGTSASAPKPVGGTAAASKNSTTKPVIKPPEP